MDILRDRAEEIHERNVQEELQELMRHPEYQWAARAEAIAFWEYVPKILVDMLNEPQMGDVLKGFILSLLRDLGIAVGVGTGVAIVGGAVGTMAGPEATIPAAGALFIAGFNGYLLFCTVLGVWDLVKLFPQLSSLAQQVMEAHTRGVERAEKAGGNEAEIREAAKLMAPALTVFVAIIVAAIVLVIVRKGIKEIANSQFWQRSSAAFKSWAGALADAYLDSVATVGAKLGFRAGQVAEKIIGAFKALCTNSRVVLIIRKVTQGYWRIKYGRFFDYELASLVERTDWLLQHAVELKSFVLGESDILFIRNWETGAWQELGEVQRILQDLFIIFDHKGNVYEMTLEQLRQLYKFYNLAEGNATNLMDRATQWFARQTPALPGVRGALPPGRMRPAPPPPEPPRGPIVARGNPIGLPGHGHARHGSQTTLAQQTTRVQTGVAPDGLNAPTGRATRFDSDDAEMEAVGRATAKVQEMDAAGSLPHFDVRPNGQTRPHREAIVVGDRPGGYGSGVEVIRNAAGQPLPGRPVQPTGQDPNALVLFQYDPGSGGWTPVTQYPTNQPVTP